MPKRVVRDAVSHFQSTKSIFSPPATVNKRDGNELVTLSSFLPFISDFVVFFLSCGLFAQCIYSLLHLLW